MTIRRAVCVALVCLVAVMGDGQRVAHASSLNSGTLFRYPWIQGETRSRSQGQFGSYDHNGNGLSYAVDWGLANQSLLVFAANSGTLRCHQQASPLQGFGDFVSVYNSVGNVTSIVPHMQQGAPCYPYIPDTPYNILQGQFIGVGDNSGNSTGNHIHFQVGAGDNETSPLISIPFTMSDHAPDPNNNNISFTDTQVYDGPSDNAGTGYTSQNPVGTDPTIINTYEAYGGSSAAWWNVGATYLSINDGNDEWGGPCRNTATAFVHYCGTNFGNGFLVVQNYIDWLNVRHSILYNMTGGGYVTAGQVKGAIQGALSNSYGGAGAISQIMGAPTDVESNGRQDFQGGYIQITLPGVRAEVYRCDPVCWLAGVTHYSADGTFCPSVNGDGFVDLSDVAAVDAHAGTSNPEYDINIDGTVNAADHDLVVSRLSTQPCPGYHDTDGDGVLDSSDNCPTVYNPDQTNTDGNNAALNRAGYDYFGDACDDNVSGDGYTNEQHLGRNPAAYCPIMRADVNGDGTVNGLDLNLLSTNFGQRFTHNYYPPNGVDTGLQRLDQNGDNVINGLDLNIVSTLYAQRVTACP